MDLRVINSNDNSINNALLRRAQSLISLGHDVIFASLIAVPQSFLKEGVMHLSWFNEGPPEDDEKIIIIICATGGAPENVMLSHNNMVLSYLAPYWQRFTDALSSASVASSGDCGCCRI